MSNFESVQEALTALPKLAQSYIVICTQKIHATDFVLRLCQRFIFSSFTLTFLQQVYFNLTIIVSAGLCITMYLFEHKIYRKDTYTIYYNENVIITDMLLFSCQVY